MTDTPLADMIPCEPCSPLPLPTKLEGLRRIAYNMYWAWHPRAQELFRLVDHKTWERTGNPIQTLKARVDFGWRIFKL